MWKKLLKSGLCVVVISLLTACELLPFKSSAIEKKLIQMRSDAGPWVVYTDMDLTLKCLGDRLREARIQPILIGYNVADTSGRTAVDQGLLMHAAIQKIAARANGIEVTSYGTGPSAPNRPMSPQLEMILRDPAAMAKLQKPIWSIEGGVISADSGFMTEQDRYGVGARDLDFGASGTVVVNVATLTYTLKVHETGVSFPGATISVRIAYQQLSKSVDAGAFVATSINGQQRGAGLRFGYSRAVTQSAADVVQLGMEFSVAVLIAEKYGVDLATCSGHTLTREEELLALRNAPKSDWAEAERVRSASELTKLFDSMKQPAERVRWVQGVLTALGYAPGPADGVHGSRTIQAIKQYQNDNGMRATGEISVTLFTHLGMRRSHQGEDPRKQATGILGEQPVHITLSQPLFPYFLGTPIRAHVLVPVSSQLWCYLQTPIDRSTVYPIVDGRPNFVSARTPIALPDNNASGPHPRVRAVKPGAHALYCAAVRIDITAKLPASLRGGGDGTGFDSIEAIRAAVRRAAGDSWIGEGSVGFNAVEKR